MTAMTDFDRLLTSILADDGPTTAPSALIDRVLAASEPIGQRRPFVRIVDTRAWPASRGSLADPALRRVGPVVLLALLAAALLTAALLVGRSPLPSTYRNLFVRTDPIPGGVRSVWPVVMADGRVLAIGGWPGASDNNATKMASILDPSTGAFTRTGDMLSEHDNGVPVALADGRVLVVAGMHNAIDPSTGLTPPIADSELFDPATGTFQSTGPLSSPRYAMAVVRLADGRVLVAGGAECLGVPEGCPDAVDKADLYDPSTGRFTPTHPLALAMTLIESASLPDGRVFLAGYLPTTTGQRPLTGAQIYDPTTSSTTATASLAAPCDLAHVVERRAAGPLMLCSESVRRTMVDADGQPLVHRGVIQFEETSLPSTVEAYDPTTDTFRRVGTLPYIADGGMERPDGRIVVFGRTTGGGAVAEIVPWAGLFDPATGETSPIAPPSRVWPASVALPDGRLVLVSGDDPVSGTPMYDAEILE